MVNLSLLSAELALEISKYLDYADQVNLSSTCRQLRQQLLRDVFGELHVSDRPEHCERVLALAREYGCYTKKLYFRARVDIYDDDYAGAKPFARPVLPKAAAMLISGAPEDGPEDGGGGADSDSDSGQRGGRRRGPLLPQLRSLTLDLRPYGRSRERPGVNGRSRTDRWTPAPTAERVGQLEQRHEWRALFTEVWAAASANRALTELTIDGYRPARRLAQATPEYRAFLGRLESLNIVITVETARSRGWDLKHAPSFQAIVCSSLNNRLFRHAGALRRLRIESREWVFLSVAVDRYPNLAKLDLATHMPLLEHVELRGFLVTQGLADCLHACRDKLRSIRLTNSIAEWQYYKLGYGNNNSARRVSFINWARRHWAWCLKRLADTGCLCRFDVDYDYPDRRQGRAPFSRADISGGEDSSHDLDPKSVVMRARALRTAEPTRPVFKYSFSRLWLVR